MNEETPERSDNQEQKKTLPVGRTPLEDEKMRRTRSLIYINDYTRQRWGGEKAIKKSAVIMLENAPTWLPQLLLIAKDENDLVRLINETVTYNNSIDENNN